MDEGSRRAIGATRSTPAIARFDRGAAGPSIVTRGKDVFVRAGIGSGTLWLVRYDPRTIPIAVRAGENDGRTIPHRNIVRQLTPLGRWSGAPLRFAIPPATGTLASALLIQSGSGGPIIAARRL